MLWAQITQLILLGIALLTSAHEHGKPKKAGTHNFFIDLLMYAITFGLLYCMGAYSKIF